MMKLQVALDRISLDEAIKLSTKLNGNVDIIEIGTSLIKDYGNSAIEKIAEVTPDSKILVDSKTIDEGAYEFNQAFRHGADIVTVMGAASYQTLTACYEVAQQYNGTMMIDLLNLNHKQIAAIDNFSEAVYLIHHSVDANEKVSAIAEIEEFQSLHEHVEHIAIAGGIDYKATSEISQQNFADIVVVGSKITTSKNIVETAKKFMEVLKA